jgi:hypothetical protein
MAYYRRDGEMCLSCMFLSYCLLSRCCVLSENGSAEDICVRETSLKLVFMFTVVYQILPEL